MCGSVVVKINHSYLVSAFTVTLMDIKLVMCVVHCPWLCKGKVVLVLCVFVVVIIYFDGCLQGGEKFTRC